MNALNLAPLWAFLTPTVSKGFLAIFAFATAKLNAFLAQHRMSQAQDDLDQALARVQSVAVAWWKSFEDHNMSVFIPGAKMNEFVSQVFEVAPAAEKILNVSPDTVATQIQAAFANWANEHKQFLSFSAAAGVNQTKQAVAAIAAKTVPDTDSPVGTAAEKPASQAV